MTMLEKAKKTPIRHLIYFRSITAEHIEVAIAWLKDEITSTQAANGLGLVLTQGNYQRHLAQIIREAVRRKIIKL